MGGATLDCRIPLADFSCAFSFAFDKTEFTYCVEVLCFFGGATLDCRIPLADFSCAFSFAFGKTEFTYCVEVLYFLEAQH